MSVSVFYCKGRSNFLSVGIDCGSDERRTTRPGSRTYTPKSILIVRRKKLWGHREHCECGVVCAHTPPRFSIVPGGARRKNVIRFGVGSSFIAPVQALLWVSKWGGGPNRGCLAPGFSSMAVAPLRARGVTVRTTAFTPPSQASFHGNIAKGSKSSSCPS